MEKNKKEARRLAREHGHRLKPFQDFMWHPKEP